MTAVSASTSLLPVAERRPGIARTVAACTLAAVALGLLATTVVLTLLDTQSKWWIASSGAVAVPAVAGMLIALYRPSNTIGWLLLADAVNVASGSSQPRTRTTG
jgi:hypothetical protein